MPPITWTLKSRPAGRALEGLADRGVRLEEQLLERLAVLDPLLELGGLAGAARSSESFSNSGWSESDVLRLLGEPLEAAALADAQNLLEGAHA